MAEQRLKPEDFDGWRQPHEAQADLDAVYGKSSVSHHLLLDRLKSGKISAVAESSTWKGIRGDKTGLIPVMRDQWEHFGAGEEFWKSGDLHLYLGHYKGSLSTVEVWYHGIKFDPNGINDLIALAPKPQTADTETALQQADKTSSKTRLPDPLLKAWYELFQKAYGGSALDTERFAEKSVEGMFPDKSVSRERIRELRGSQKRGRKSSEAAK